jgi:hypothetical protein
VTLPITCEVKPLGSRGIADSGFDQITARPIRVHASAIFLPTEEVRGSADGDSDAEMQQSASLYFR